jgi:hypothetical protein
MPAAAKLPPFETNDVVGTRVKITGAGDGLSEALKVAPRALQHGEEVTYLLRGVVKEIDFPQDKEGDVWRVHTVKTSSIIQVDEDTANELLQAAAEELQRRRAAAEGQDPLPEAEPEDR